MALKNQKFQTLVDVMNLAGRVPGDVVNMTSQMNPMIEDAPAYPCNRGGHHVTILKTDLPDSIWGKSYQGIPASKGRNQQLKHTPGYVESACEMDRKILDEVSSGTQFTHMQGAARANAVGKARVNLMEDAMSEHAEGMSQEVARACLYEDQRQNPERITGFMPFLNSLTGVNATQVINAGGTGADNTSILMVTWDKTTMHFIYPQGPGYKGGGFKAGPLLKEYSLDSDGNKYRVYRRDMRWGYWFNC